ncbi:MAG TPA: lipopolysaccharide biosynthesis protein [Candidatus Nitrosocosmicus sp.]|nr:lipopolysaccharide biosynthesis protein [Candidatus Nitrosocosmicus sp.]
MSDTKKNSNEHGKPIHRSQVLKGVGWNVFEIIARGGFKFIAKLILARIILPEHFGLVGMAVVFTGLAETINELGLGAALIQIKEDKLKEIHFSTAFVCTLVFGWVSFLAMAVIIGPIVSDFYNEPILHSVIVVLSLPIILKPLTLVHRVKLMRKLNFKPISIIESFASVVAGVAGIIMAILGFGVWSIALQGIIAALVTIPLMWRVEPWTLKRDFSKEAFSDIFNFGAFVLVKNVTNYFAGNVDYFIIGKILGGYYLGIYTLAFTLTDVFRSQLMGVMNKVMFPVYAKVQHDTQLAGRYYLKIIRYNTLLILPIMGCMAIYAGQLTAIFFGTKWIEMVLPLQMLSISVFFHVATGSLSTVLTGLGKVKVDFSFYLAKTFIITVPALLLGIHYWGINGAAIAILVSKFLSFIINIFISRYYIAVKAWEIVNAIVPASVGTIALWIASLILNRFFGSPDNILLLVVYGFVLMLVYMMIILPFTGKEILELYNWLIKKAKRKKLGSIQ